MKQRHPSGRGYEQSVGRGGDRRAEVRHCGPGSNSVGDLSFPGSGLYRQAQWGTFLILYFGVFSPTLTPLQVHSLKLALEGVEKERDFYFGKLREIELLCQEHGQENDDLVQRLMEVLYASEEHVSVRRALNSCVQKQCSWSGCRDE